MLSVPLTSLSRGVNLSRWFRYPTTDSESHFRAFITDADLDLLVAMGVTCVRFAADPAYLLRGELPDSQRLAWIDEAVSRMTLRGLVVVFDYHDESRRIESGPAAVASLERTWAALAAHFNRTTSPAQVLLEIFNEPVFDRDPAAWFPIRRRLAAVIRGAAPRHTVVAGGPNWSSLDGLLHSEPLADDNVLYTFHFYEPFAFTHQGAPWVDGAVRAMAGVRYPGPDGTRRDMAGRIGRAAEWGRRWGVSLWAGEFGSYPAVAPVRDRLLWMHDVRTVFEDNGIGWAVWSYDESLGLDRRVTSSGAITLDWPAAAALGLRVPGAIA